MQRTGEQVELIRLMRDLLAENYTHLHVKRVVVEEDLEQGATTVSCEVTNERTGESLSIVGRGVGVVDAFFHGMVERFAESYPSLKTLKFTSFSVEARLDTKKDYAGSDSEGEVTLELQNSEGRTFVFTHASRSVTAGAIITTLLGMEYFINSERAFVSVYNALADAQKRNRPDLVQGYTNTLAILVKNTSYSEVIDKIREKL